MTLVGRKNVIDALAIAVVGGGLTTNLYDLKNVGSYYKPLVKPVEFGAPFRGVESHKRRKKGKR